MRDNSNRYMAISVLIMIGWIFLSMQGLLPDPFTPFTKIASGDVPILNELKTMNCDMLQSWIVNKTGSITPYQSEANSLFETKCQLPNEDLS